MKLLDRIARSNGDPQRAMMALRLINERLERALGQQSPAHLPPDLDLPGLAARLQQVERHRGQDKVQSNHPAERKE